MRDHRNKTGDGSMTQQVFNKETQQEEETNSYFLWHTLHSRIMIYLPCCLHFETYKFRGFVCLLYSITKCFCHALS